MIFTSANGASVKRRVVMNALIIGLGNDYRSDDAVGRVVARKLGAESLDGVRILEESGEGAASMDAWRGADFVILIDAVHSGAKPGTIYRIDAHAEEILRSFFHYSTHVRPSRRRGASRVSVGRKSRSIRCAGRIAGCPAVAAHLSSEHGPR